MRSKPCCSLLSAALASAALVLPAPARASGIAGDGGPATAAELSLPSAVATLPDGTVLIADTGHGRVRAVDPSGVIATVAGGGTAATGPAASTDIELVRPTGLAVDPAGGFLVADAGADHVWRIADEGVASIVAGTGERGFGGDGGPATAARLAKPTGIAVSPGGALLIADQGNDRVRRVSLDGTIVTVAGGASAAPSDVATLADLDAPSGVAALANGGFLVADAGNHRIVQVAYGVLTTVAGTGVAGFTLGGGPATMTPLGTPVDVASTADGGFVVVDQGNQQVRRVDARGVITTAIGTGDAGIARSGNPAKETDLAWPGGIASAPGGQVIVANTAANVVLARSVDGTTTVVAGKAKRATAGTAIRLGGYHVWLDRPVRVRRGCRLRVAYSADYDGRARLTIGAGRRAWSGSIKAPHGTVRGGAVHLRPATYRLHLTVKRNSDGRRSRAQGRLVVLERRCRG